MSKSDKVYNRSNEIGFLPIEKLTEAIDCINERNITDDAADAIGLIFSYLVLALLCFFT